LKQTIQDFTPIHVFCWILPLVLTLLPLTTDTIGPYKHSDHSDAEICFINPRDDSPYWTITFWYVFSFYLWLWLAIAAMIVCYSTVIYTVKSTKDEFSMSSTFIFTALDKLKLYPLILTLCWTIASFVDMNNVTKPSTENNYPSVVEVLSAFPPFLFGLFSSIAYFVKNPDVRVKLYDWIRNKKDDEVDKVDKVERPSNSDNEASRTSNPILNDNTGIELKSSESSV
jgi:hypothetical protein